MCISQQNRRLAAFCDVLYGVLTNVFWLGRETGDNRVPAASTTTRNEETERKTERAEREKETSSPNSVDLMPSIQLSLIIYLSLVLVSITRCMIIQSTKFLVHTYFAQIQSSSLLLLHDLSQTSQIGKEPKSHRSKQEHGVEFYLRQLICYHYEKIPRAFSYRDIPNAERCIWNSACRYCESQMSEEDRVLPCGGSYKKKKDAVFSLLFLDIIIIDRDATSFLSAVEVTSTAAR